MECEISQKKISYAEYKCLFGILFWIFLLLTLTFSLIKPVQIKGQTVKSKSNQTNRNLQFKFRLSEQQSNDLRPLVQKQIICLQKIFTRFSEKVDINFLSFWIDTDVWLELKDDRKFFAVNLREILTKEQTQVLQSARFDLEEENLLDLLDEKMPILDEELDLEDQQEIDIHKVLTQDIKKKRLLINNPSSSDDSLIGKLKAVSDETENKIKKILFPEQNKTYQKNKQNSQKSGIRLWGVVPPSTSDLPQTISAKFHSPKHLF